MQQSKNRLLRRNPSSKFSEKNVKRPPSRPMVSLPKTKIITNKSVKTNDTLLRKFPCKFTIIKQFLARTGVFITFKAIILLVIDKTCKGKLLV